MIQFTGINLPHKQKHQMKKDGHTFFVSFSLIYHLFKQKFCANHLNDGFHLNMHISNKWQFFAGQMPFPLPNLMSKLRNVSQSTNSSTPSRKITI